jgi:2',3'-cyclic-nucleotide 2'-phosphodiesterase (5'-nucleotidase family)
MRFSFRYTLLITFLLAFAACKTQFIQEEQKTQNIAVSNDVNGTDSSIVALYAPYKHELENDMNRVISFSDEGLDKDKPESSLTNFLADLLIEEGTIIAQEKGFNMKPDVSFFNYGGIRSSLPKGDITVGNAYELMPFENELVFLELKGPEMKEFLDYIALHKGGSVGGVRMIISGDKATNVEIGGKPFDINQSYWLATNDYVAGGGDGLFFLKKNIKYIESGERLRDVIISHLEKAQKNNKKITAELDGRISYDN